jgi:hypothetical protein
MRIISILVLALGLLITGCQDGYIQETGEVLMKNTADEAEREYFQDETVEGFFWKELGMKGLEKHEVYKTGDTLNADFYFTAEAQRNDIGRSRDFVMRMFVLRQMYPIGGGPYCRLVTDGVEWEQVDYRAYIEGTPVLRESLELQQDGQFSSNYYENTGIELASRMIDEELTGEFAKDIRKNYWAVQDVVTERSYKGNVLIIKLKGWKKYNDKAIQDIKDRIEKDLAPVLEAASKEKYRQNMDYLGLVLQLYSRNKKYHEELFYNGEEKEWLQEDWMNYDFFGRNIEN